VGPEERAQAMEEDGRRDKLGVKLSTHDKMDTGEEEEEEEERENDWEGGDIYEALGIVSNGTCAPFAFPDPVSRLGQNNDGVFFLLPNIHGLPCLVTPQLVNALMAMPDVRDKTHRVVAAQLALPMPVHQSPMLALFAAQLPSQHPLVLHPVVSWVESALRLFALVPHLLSDDPAIQRLPNRPPEWAKQCVGECFAQIRRAEALHQTEISQLHKLTLEEPATFMQRLSQFVCILKTHSLYILHSLEHLLFSVFIEPFCPNAELRLEHVLTPISEACASPREDIRNHAIQFFRQKAHMMPSEVSVFSPDDFHMRLTVKEGQVRFGPTTTQSKVYGNYVTLHTLGEYFLSLDSDGILNFGGKDPSRPQFTVNLDALTF
jgi:hypothetical protein